MRQRTSSEPGRVDARRREFLIRACQAATAAMIPAERFRFLPLYSDSAETIAGAEFHFHPHYRMPGPLDALLLKTKAGSDDFVTEQYADEIAALLEQWSAGLLQSPRNVGAIEKSLSTAFSGTSLRSSESRVVRSGPTIFVDRHSFGAKATIEPRKFISELRSSLSLFSKVLRANFEVTRIDASSAPDAPWQTLRTEIRYELVGTSPDVYRLQRVGNWGIEWNRAVTGELLIRKWSPLDETESRSSAPCYFDIANAALGMNDSYSAQLLHGSDYWRTVLDGASGIDIYGHNGVSVGDIDGDGFDDLYVCQPGGLPNRLYRNRGDGTFEDITEASGVGVIENTACALFVDVDNDGRQDLIVVRATGPMLFLNRGGGKFRQKANAFQFLQPPQGTFTGAAVADYDRDGWLDIYFCLYVFYQGTDQYKYPSPYYDANNGPPNFLLRNNRDGTFSDVTSQAGLNVNNTRYSFCCGWNDFNGEGWPDLYVVNDFGRKNLYRNNGNGTFTDVASLKGVEDVGAGMSVCWFDYDNDGAEDLHVADMWTAPGQRISAQPQFKQNAPAETRALFRKHAMGDSLFRNTGLNGRSSSSDSSFKDVTSQAGVGIGRWAWSSDSWDFDHDGYADLYIVNGMVSGPSREDLNSFFWRQVVALSPEKPQPAQDYEQGWNVINELIRSDGTWSGYERNIFYSNNRDGTFSDISAVIGLDFIEDGRAFALADFDHDGRQEVFLKNRNAPQVRLLKNQLEKLPPAIAFCLRGLKSNRDAIGAIVALESDVGRQSKSLQAGSGFLSQHSKEVFFGLGSAKGPIRASIRWPSGLVQELHGLPINHRIVVEEGSQSFKLEPFRSARSGPEVVRAESARVEVRSEHGESMPSTVETWMLAPVEAPDISLPDLHGETKTLSAQRGKPVLLNFWMAAAGRCREDWVTLSRHGESWAASGLQLITVNLDKTTDWESVERLIRREQLSFPILQGSEDVGAVYNILYRYLFDRHRDLPIPTSFLIDEKGYVVKVYQGPLNASHVEENFRRIPRTIEDRVARALPFPGIRDDVEFGRNYLSYGSVFFQRGYMDQAKACFEVALRDDPSSAEARYGIGSVYLDQQRTVEARNSFQRALKLRASYPDTLANSWNNLGLLSAREGNTGEAIHNFQEALKLNPDHVIALDNLGSAYRQQKSWDDALKTYRRALAINPSDPEGNYGLGMLFAQKDDTSQAFDSLQKALKLRPVFPEALNNLGILYLRTQRRDNAVATFEECIRVAPSFEQAYLNLARVYAIENTPDEERTILNELLKQHPDNRTAQQMLDQLGH